MISVSHRNQPGTWRTDCAKRWVRTQDVRKPVEVDASYCGGLEKNKHANKKLNAKRGTVGKAIVAGMKDQETGQIKTRVVSDATAQTLQGFVYENVADGAKVYTGESTSYQGLPTHENVKAQRSEWGRDQAHTNGMESFWAALKRNYHGVYHPLSAKHLHRHANEFAGRHNFREQGTIEQMRLIARQLVVGKRLMYKNLTV